MYLFPIFIAIVNRLIRDDDTLKKCVDSENADTENMILITSADNEAFSHNLDHNQGRKSFDTVLTTDYRPHLNKPPQLHELKRKLNKQYSQMVHLIPR